MMFTEASTAENLECELLCGDPRLGHRQGKLSGLGWHCLAPADIPRHRPEVLVEDWTWGAPVGLNPEIAAIPHRAAEVLYKLRAIISVRSDGRIRRYVSACTS